MPKIKYPELHEKQIIGHLMLVRKFYKVDKKLTRSRTYWACKCRLCGREFEAREDSIKNGDQISCGCMGKKMRSFYLLHNGKK